MTLDSFAAAVTRQHTPGPGAYFTEGYSGVGNKYSIHVNVRPKFDDGQSSRADVGFRDIPSSLSNRSCAIRPKTQLREPSTQTPGPMYRPDPMQNFQNSVAIKIRHKDPDILVTPGPGKYTPQTEWPRTRTPQMGSRAKIVLCEAADSPGPARYDVLHEFGGATPRYTIRPRTELPSDRSANPGLTYNNPPVLGDSARRWTMPRAPPPAPDISDVPGPGSYEQDPRPASRLAPAIRPSCRKRRREQPDPPLENVRRFPDVHRKTIGPRAGRNYWEAADRTIPGPAFMPESTLRRGALSIGERRPAKGTQETPGPGDYNPADPRNQESPMFSCMGFGDRNDWLPKPNLLPGPGEYEVRKGNDRPKWTIGDKSISRTARSTCSSRESLVTDKRRPSS
jgi:hypothetical protein